MLRAFLAVMVKNKLSNNTPVNNKIAHFIVLVLNITVPPLSWNVHLRLVWALSIKAIPVPCIQDFCSSNRMYLNELLLFRDHSAGKYASPDRGSAS
jgi:hypothetical protein